jgi:hypothetical protein
VAKYEAEMVPRGLADVEESVKNAEMIHDWNRIPESTLITKGTARIPAVNA